MEIKFRITLYVDTLMDKSLKAKRDNVFISIGDYVLNDTLRNIEPSFIIYDQVGRFYYFILLFIQHFRVKRHIFLSLKRDFRHEITPAIFYYTTVREKKLYSLENQSQTNTLKIPT